jgi:aryl-alcohol dehydrogenase-like predicted oxidoreductase
METRRLGITDLKVSKICLGTMTWGEQNTEAEAHAQMDLALASGVNFFDTAELYPVPPKGETQGLTEAYIGSWFKKTGNRSKVVLATKAAGSGEWVSHIRGGPELTLASMSEAVDISLSRLQTDYIDLYQIHWPSRATNYFGLLGYEHQEGADGTSIEETLEGLAELIKQGKIRHYGLSNETAWGTMKFIQLADQKGLPRPVSVQNPYNLLNRSYEIGLAEVSIRENVGLLPYSPLAFGVLTGKYRNGARPEGARLTLFERFQRYHGDVAAKAIDEYCELAAEFGLSPAVMSLAFVNDQAFVTSNIIGATSLTQLEENISSAELALSEALIGRIHEIHSRISNPCP